MINRNTINVTDIKTFDKSDVLDVQPISFEDALKREIVRRGPPFFQKKETMHEVVNSNMDKKEKVEKLKNGYGSGGSGSFGEEIYQFDGWTEYTPSKGFKILDEKWNPILSLTWNQLYNVYEGILKKR